MALTGLAFPSIGIMEDRLSAPGEDPSRHDPMSVEALKQSSRKLTKKGGTSGSKNATKKSDSGSQMKNLEAEMQLLSWHKIANEQALKAALIRTKKMKRPENPGTIKSLQDKAGWMHQVIEEEQRKPLQVSKDYMMDYEEKERAHQVKLDDEVQRHIETLRKMRIKAEDRDDARKRKAQFASTKVHLAREKGRLLNGNKTTASSSRRPSARSRPETTSRISDDNQSESGDLTTVISSLDKLVALEKRISSLEDNSAYDDMHTNDTKGRTQKPRTGFQFTKKKAAPSVSLPACRTYYSVKVTGKQPRNRAPQSRQATGLTSRFSQGRRPPQEGKSSRRLVSLKNDRRRTGGEGTFLTGMPEEDEANQMTSQQRGSKPLTRASEKRFATGRTYQKRRKDPLAGKGASGGKKHGNAAMQSFHDLRGQMEKRKANMRKLLAKDDKRSMKARMRGAKSSTTASSKVFQSSARTDRATRASIPQRSATTSYRVRTSTNVKLGGQFKSNPSSNGLKSASSVRLRRTGLGSQGSSGTGSVRLPTVMGVSGSRQAW